MPSTTCVKCSGQMEMGLLVDASNPSGTAFAQSERALEWVRGTPKKSFWTDSFKEGPGNRLQVATLRCRKCGYVELYAPAEPG